MSFTTSAFTESTPEMREWLESIGYKDYDQSEGNTLCTVFDGSYQAKNYKLGKTMFQVYLNMIKPIDCRSNPALFKAITSIREDSDCMQWFTDGKKWTLCMSESICSWRDILNFDNKDLVHKATPAELIEHFK